MFVKTGEHFISPAWRSERSRVSRKPGQDGSRYAFARSVLSPPPVCVLCSTASRKYKSADRWCFLSLKKTPMWVQMVLLGDGKCNSRSSAAERPCYYSLDLCGFIMLWFERFPRNISRTAWTSRLWPHLVQLWLKQFWQSERQRSFRGKPVLCGQG